MGISIENRLLAVSGFLVLCVILVDSYFPLGAAEAIPLVAILLIGLWFPVPKQILVIVLACAAAVAIGYFMSPAIEQTWAEASNRGLAVLAIVVSGFLIFAYRTKRDAPVRKTAEPSESKIMEAFRVVGAWQTVIAQMLLLFALGLTFFSMKETEKVLTQISQHQLVQHQISDVLSHMQNLETGQRGYLLTGNERYLQPFNSSITKIDDYVARLEQLVSENSMQSRWIKNLDPLIEDKISELEETIELRRNSGLPAALAIVETDRGKIAMEKIRLVLRDIGKVEDNLLAESEREFGNLKQIVLVSCLILLGIIVGIPLLVMRRVQQFISFREGVERDLQNAKDEAEAANKAKSAFLSSMSHEIRTPLNVILGFAQLLKQYVDNTLSKKQLEATESILKAGNHLLGLIDEILDLATVETGKTSISRSVQNPASTIEECITIARNLADEKGLKLVDQSTTYSLPEIDIDETRFRQVLLNILSNAIKYNRPDGAVTMSVSEPNTGRLRISVSDTGFGIPEEKLSAVFTPFERLGMENSEVSGTGIGLSLTQSLVEAMDGEIGFESKLNIGSTFWIEFPIRHGQLSSNELTMDTGVEQAAALNRDRPRILYVDDDPTSLQFMESLVTHVLRMEYVSAHMGELGLSLAETMVPDVILLDINLPDINGLDIVKRIRSSERLKNTPVFAVTARASLADRKEGLKAGFDEYFPKPVNVSEMAKAIRIAVTQGINDDRVATANHGLAQSEACTAV